MDKIYRYRIQRSASGRKLVILSAISAAIHTNLHFDGVKKMAIRSGFSCTHCFNKQKFRPCFRHGFIGRPAVCKKPTAAQKNLCCGLGARDLLGGLRLKQQACVARAMPLSTMGISPSKFDLFAQGALSCGHIKLYLAVSVGGTCGLGELGLDLKTTATMSNGQ